MTQSQVQAQIENVINNVFKDVGQRVIDKQSIAGIIEGIRLVLPFTCTGDVKFGPGPDGNSIVPLDLRTALLCMGKPVWYAGNSMKEFIDHTGTYSWQDGHVVFMPTAPVEFIDVKFTVHKDGHVMEGSLKELPRRSQRFSEDETARPTCGGGPCEPLHFDRNGES